MEIICGQVNYSIIAHKSIFIFCVSGHGADIVALPIIIFEVKNTSVIIGIDDKR